MNKSIVGQRWYYDMGWEKIKVLVLDFAATAVDEQKQLPVIAFAGNKLILGH